MEANFLTALQLPFLSTVLQIAAITLPIAIGMIAKRYVPGLADNPDKPVKWLSLFFLAVIITGVLLRERNNFVSYVIRCRLDNSSFECGCNSFRFCDRYLTRLGEKCVTAIPVKEDSKWDTGDRFYTYTAEYSHNSHSWGNLWSANVCD